MATTTHPPRDSASTHPRRSEHAGGATRDAWPGDQMRLMDDDCRSWRHDRYRQQPDRAGALPRAAWRDDRVDSA